MCPGDRWKPCGATQKYKLFSVRQQEAGVRQRENADCIHQPLCPERNSMGPLLPKQLSVPPAKAPGEVNRPLSQKKDWVWVSVCSLPGALGVVACRELPSVVEASGDSATQPSWPPEPGNPELSPGWQPQNLGHQTGLKSSPLGDTCSLECCIGRVSRWRLMPQVKQMGRRFLKESCLYQQRAFRLHF